MEVVGVGKCIHILTSWVNILAVCKGIGFSAKAAGVVTNQVVKAGKILRPMDLSTHQLLGGGEILKVLVVRKDQNNVVLIL